MSEDIRRLIAYRLDQAQETLNAARELAAAGHERDAVNRGYYAMFYGALAMLASKGLGASKHSGVLSLLGRHFIKTGAFPVDYGRYLREAFELRQAPITASLFRLRRSRCRKPLHMLTHSFNAHGKCSGTANRRMARRVILRFHDHRQNLRAAGCPYRRTTDERHHSHYSVMFFTCVCSGGRRRYKRM